MVIFKFKLYYDHSAFLTHRPYRNRNLHIANEVLYNNDDDINADSAHTAHRALPTANHHKKSHFIQNIQRGRREASVAIDNLLRVPPPSNIEGTCLIYATSPALVVITPLAIQQTKTNRTWTSSIRSTGASWRKRTRSSRSCTAPRVRRPAATIGSG